jgi:hypothetical protein
MCYKKAKQEPFFKRKEKMTMHWDIERNTIEKLFVNGENIIQPWGVETADSSAFFSLEDGFGYRYSVLHHSIEYTDTTCSMKMVVSMKEGKWELTIEDAIVDATKISRRVHLLCLEDSYFMDFVMRFRFSNAFFSKAYIADKVYTHKNTNIYYQYPVDTASLEGERYNVNITVKDSVCSPHMKPHMYVRDNDGEWVVHARMIPQQWQKEVIKLCNNWAKTRPLPQCISRPLLAIPSVREALWYRGERGPFTGKVMRRIQPLACPLVQMKAGEELMWDIEMTIQEKERIK